MTPRIFEFTAGDVISPASVRRVIIDLDAIVRLIEVGPEPRWAIAFSDGSAFFVTKAAFDRTMLAWKSE